DRVFRIRRIVRKVDACQQVPQAAAHEHDDRQVRGLQYAARSGDAAGFDRGEAKFAVGAGQNATKTAEPRVDRRILRVSRTRIFALRVGLPDFESAIVDGLAVAVEQAPLNADALARGFDRSDSVDQQRGKADPEIRSYGLRGSGQQAHDSIQLRFVSIGVSSRPRSTTSKRYASAMSGIVR